MANYQNLMAAISAVIKTNNRREITGQILQNVLNEMVGSLGENMQLTGFANPLTNPGTPDQNVFYFATQAGIYHHFDDIELDDGFSVLMWKNGQWTSNTLEIAVTRQWVQNNFVSIEFFRKMFRAYDSGGAEVVPNDVQGVIDNIKAMCGMWTEQYLTALGLGSGGGGSFARYLNDLLDVTITNVQGGQALIYNSTLQQWVNGTAGVDMSTVWSNLAGATSEQINISHLSTALTDYVVRSEISDMATRTWVTSNFITIAYFDRLFRAYNGSTLVSHNDTTTTIDNIKSMFGFWTEFYLSALGTGGISTVGIGLSQLNDVTLTNPTGGQALVYDALTNKWVNGTVAGVTSLSALSDVELTAPATYQVLMYDASTTKWYNTSLKTINGINIFGNGNIEVGGGASGNYLPLAGGTMTGDYPITFTPNRIALEFREHPSNTYSSRVEYMTSGNEALVFSNGNPVTSYIFKCGQLITNTSDWTNITPSMQIKNQSVYINSLIATGESPSYNLYVSGTVYATTSIRASGIYLEKGNEINTYNTGLYLLYSTSDSLYLCHGGGNVNIGSTVSTNYKLNVVGTGCFSEALKAMGLEIGHTNEINSYDGNNNNLHLNFRSSGYVSICNGGGNVVIGASTDYGYQLYVNGRIAGNNLCLSDGGRINVKDEPSGSTFFIGNSGNQGWVRMQDVCGASGTAGDGSGWSIRISGNALFANVQSNGYVTALSDIRHKTVIKDAAVSVDDIARMPAVMYQWNDGREDKELHVGSIAQNWQTVLPEVVLRANDKEGTLSMQYGVAALVSSIIIARKVVNHEERIKQLEKENKELKERLNIA